MKPAAVGAGSTHTPELATLAAKTRLLGAALAALDVAGAGNAAQKRLRAELARRGDACDTVSQGSPE